MADRNRRTARSRRPEYDDYDEYDNYDGFGYPEDDYDEPVRRRSSGSRQSRNTGRGGYDQDDRKRSGRRKKRKKSGSPAVFIVLLIILLCGAFGFKIFLDRYSYSKEEADLNEYFSMQGEQDAALIWGNEISDIRLKYLDGTYYMDLGTVKERLNDRFYYGRKNASDETGMIMYALPEQMVSVIPGSTEVTTGDQSETKTYIPARKEGDTLYLALDFVKEYTNFSYTAFSDPNRVQLDNVWEEQEHAVISRKTQIRTSGGIKSDVLEQLEKDDVVTVLERMETWSKVKSADSIIGYVENKRLKDESTYAETPVTSYTEPEYAAKMMSGRVNMAFHNVWGSQGNVTLEEYMAPTKTVNVIAPTWFWVTDNDGNMVSAAQADYVQRAHNMGLQVWGVVDNFNYEGLQDHSTFLTTLDSRTNLINKLILEADACGMDGINVDFEQVDAACGEDFIQFVRELSIVCRKRGLTLSVDNYVPYAFNDYYNIGEQGVFADYVVIMGYDEHYAGSQEAGSVASIDYVTDGITHTLAKVPREKVINALPFYARIWWTRPNGVTSEAHGMADIRTFISNHGMSVSWDSKTAQNYAETTEGDALIQIWIEDAQSIREKLNVMQANEIAGVAEWRLQFETPDIWDEIANYMNS